MGQTQIDQKLSSKQRLSESDFNTFKFKLQKNFKEVNETIVMTKINGNPAENIAWLLELKLLSQRLTG